MTVSPHQQALIATKPPSKFGQAPSGADSSFWKMGTDPELEAHRKSYTWNLVPRIAGMNILTSKWAPNVMETRSTSENTIIPKARIVARGVQEIHGVDYSKNYASVDMFTSLRSLLGVLPHFDLELHQIDVITAFQNVKREENITWNSQKELKSITGKLLFEIS